MKRRTYLMSLSALSTPLLAGCTSNQSSDPTVTVDPAATQTNQPEPTTTTTQPTTSAPTLNVEWDTVAGAEIGNGYHFPRPALAGETLIVASGLNDAGVIEAYDAQTGDRQWEFSTGVSMNSPHPLPATDSLIAEFTSEGLQAIRVDDGDVSWSEDVNSYGDPLAVEDTIYAPTFEGVEARGFDGEQRWTWEVDSRPSYIGGDQNAVYTKAGTSLYAIDATEGETIWKTRTTMQPSTAPVVADGLVVLGRDNGHLTALHRDSHEEAWDVNLERRVAAPVGVGESAVYAAGWSSELHAIDPADGSTKWTFSPDVQTISRAIEVDGVVYVGCSGGLYARHADDGSPLWTLETESPVWAPPCVADDYLYVTTEAGGIYCVQSRTD